MEITFVLRNIDRVISPMTTGDMQEETKAPIFVQEKAHLSQAIFARMEELLWIYSQGRRLWDMTWTGVSMVKVTDSQPSVKSPYFEWGPYGIGRHLGSLDWNWPHKFILSAECTLSIADEDTDSYGHANWDVKIRPIPFYEGKVPVK